MVYYGWFCSQFSYTSCCWCWCWKNVSSHHHWFWCCYYWHYFLLLFNDLLRVYIHSKFNSSRGSSSSSSMNSNSFSTPVNFNTFWTFLIFFQWWLSYLFFFSLSLTFKYLDRTIDRSLDSWNKIILEMIIIDF